MPQNLSSGELAIKNHQQSGDGNYLPFSFNTITENIALYAAKHLNESEETKKAAIKELCDIVKRDRNIICDVELAQMCILRAKKFNAQRAATSAVKAIDFAKKYGELIDRMDTKLIQRFTKKNIIGFLPYRDFGNRAVAYTRVENWNPDEIPPKDVLFGTAVCLHAALENEVNQVLGFVGILDLKGLTMKQLLTTLPWIHAGIYAWQYCCACRIKHIYVINTPKIFKIIWNLAKPLLTEKMRKRISIYKQGKNDIFKAIPSEMLPTEFGGQLGKLSNDHWAFDTDAMMKIYCQNLSYLELPLTKNMKHCYTESLTRHENL